MTQVAQLLLSLSFLVAVHEFGHLLTAKYFGMRVEQFSIGFPPKIWSFRKGETEYALSAIPLGGYVKISGMIDESLDKEAMSKPPQPWEFRSKPAWQRLIVMLGGIFVNVVIGILIFIGLTWVYGDQWIKKDVVNAHGGFSVGSVGEKIGLKPGDKIVQLNGKDYNYVEELINPENLLVDNATYTVERDGEQKVLPIPGDFIKEFNKRDGPMNFLSLRIQPIVYEVAKGTIAEKVGLKPGDAIVEVSGQPVTWFDEVYTLVQATKTDSIAFKIKRGAEILTYHEKFQGEAKQIGFRPVVPETLKAEAEENITYGFFESIPLGTKRAFSTLAVQITAFGKIFKGELPFRESVSGPLGIMDAFGKVWDWHRFWRLTGVLSLVLAFMNLLPIPALDGGHVMFLTYEIVSNRKPSDKFLEIAQKAGMILLLGLMVLIFANDIIKKFF